VRAIDTNILVRFLANDDPRQSPKARAIIEAGDVYVPTTVFLEAEWVLRSAYEYGATQIVSAFEVFAGLPGIAIEDPDLLALALDLASDGLDFADALHLGRARDCEAFITFDRKLVNAAKGLGSIEVRVP
jgi:predicted nucleic-acid-binding protein